jgi:hypothetical protein
MNKADQGKDEHFNNAQQRAREREWGERVLSLEKAMSD